MLLAKTVIPNQYWILRDRDRKVGNIEAAERGFCVEIDGQQREFSSLSTIQSWRQIQFSPGPATQEQHQVGGLPTAHRCHNPLWNCRLRAWQYTLAPRSRSWRAAGWWIVAGSVMFCPKIIVLERRCHQGPFLTREAADAALA